MRATIALHIEFEGELFEADKRVVLRMLAKALPSWVELEDWEVFKEESWGLLMSGGTVALRKGV